VTNPKDDALRRTGRAAQQYEVSEDRIARDYRRLAEASATKGPMYVAGLQAGYLHASLLDVAEAHKADCSAPSCATCEAIAGTVAMMLAFARVEVDSELSRLL
jgi:hypothetical protein